MEPGDKIRIITKDETIEGVYIQSTSDSGIIIKLDSGYNISLNKKDIKVCEVIKKKEERKDVKKDRKEKENLENKELPEIAILHTGGTIASKVDYDTGGVVARFSPEELLEMFPEIRKFARIKSRLISNMFSEDMRFEHYNIIAKEVEKEIKSGVKGVIITHGTDTMHYTSAALSFMLCNLTKPVILVGSQRSSDRGSSDAALNIINAVYFITKSNFNKVGICMHEKIDDESCVILDGLKARKMHSSRRDAFKPINSEPIARVNFKNNEIKINTHKNLYENNIDFVDERLFVRGFKPNIKVGILKIHPNMSANEFLAYKGFDGLIIEGTGLGHAPINEIDAITKEHTKIKEAIKELCKETVVAMSTQTIYGRIQMNVYSTGRELQSIGVIGNFCDMTPETSFIKLAWLLSNYEKDEVRKLFSQNIAGEISERSVYDGK